MSKNKHAEDCDCDLPKIRDSFKPNRCSNEQICKCHGQEKLDEIKSQE
ncbi:MAG: hypothetical protein GY870_10625 [archaeon]|nr:hypothetical protein [archaeon]